MNRKTPTASRRKVAKAGLVLFTAALAGLAFLVPDAMASGQVGNYVALKGGFYSPSATFDLGNIETSGGLQGTADTGVAGELAYGHYFSPSFALEVGVGYFRSKGTFAAPSAGGRELKFNVIPVIVSAKVFVPVGPVFPYGEAGLGAYFSEFDISDNANSFAGTTTFGAHVGAGLNVDVSSHAFVGLEMRYVWDDPSFGDQQIDLNGDDYALNGFNLNGFTTTFVLGFGF